MAEFRKYYKERAAVTLPSLPKVDSSASPVGAPGGIRLTAVSGGSGEHRPEYLAAQLQRFRPVQDLPGELAMGLSPSSGAR